VTRRSWLAGSFSQVKDRRSSVGSLHNTAGDTVVSRRDPRPAQLADAATNAMPASCAHNDGTRRFIDLM
jgi:hypothetical protein